MIERKIQKSRLYNTNTYALVTLKACEEILGVGGVNTILNRANLSHLINNYPPHNREKAFDFADYSALMMALEDIYGLRGGRVMGMRIGRATFMDLLSNYGAMVGVTDLAFKILPVSIKLRIGINAMAKVFNMVSDQETEVVEYENYFHYIVKQCPVCWGRHDEEKPVCFSQVGLIKGGLNWVTNGKEFNVKEVYCYAMGDEHCTFRILKTPISY